MEIKGIKAPVIEAGQEVFAVLQSALDEPLVEQDILCVTSKVVSVEQGRMVGLSDVRPSAAARQMRKLRYSKDFESRPELAELVLQEAERLFVGEGGFVYLTLKNGVLIANAGIDLSNAPEGYAVLPPGAAQASITVVSGSGAATSTAKELPLS